MILLNLSCDLSDFGKILAWFYYPTDSSKQTEFYKHYLLTLKVRRFAKGDASGEIPEAFIELCRMNSMVSDQDVSQRLREVKIAGSVLCYVYDMVAYGIKEPSKNKATWLLSKEYGVSPSTITRCWRNYYSVITLCASFVAYSRQLDNWDGDTPAWMFGQWLESLINLSRRFWEWGSALKDRNHTPLLTYAAWEPPARYSINLGKKSIIQDVFDQKVGPTKGSCPPIAVYRPSLEERLKEYQNI